MELIADGIERARVEDTAGRGGTAAGEQTRAEGRRVPGLGHRVSHDTILARLSCSQMARSGGVAGRGVTFVEALDRVAEQVKRSRQTRMACARPLIRPSLFFIGVAPASPLESPIELARERPMRIEIHGGIRRQDRGHSRTNLIGRWRRILRIPVSAAESPGWKARPQPRAEPNADSSTAIGHRVACGRVESLSSGAHANLPRAGQPRPRSTRDRVSGAADQRPRALASSGVSVTERPAINWSSCSRLVTLTIGAATPGWRRIQASATWIGSTPLRRATSTTASATS